MRRVRLGFAAVVLVALGVAMGSAFVPELRSAPPGKPIDQLGPADRAAVEQLETLSRGFTAVAGLVTPSVVTITSEGTTQPTADNNPFQQFFGDPRFQQFFGDFMRPRKTRGLGSGVIVREDGYILTNNHVVQGAEELTVWLGDERELTATVVGTDPRSDIAVLKVDAEGLPAAQFGDSDGVQIGEWVLAVGSPFSANLNTSVTSGIVSALGRNGVGLNVYEDFIQTDAPINPGNSGGALVNLRGEVIGINTGIASRGGGSNGIGFAIPANMARDVMEDLIASGRVNRGWLGVTIGDLDENLAEALGADDTHGALIQSVVQGSPAEDAGIEQGDVVVSLDGKAIKGRRDLQMAVGRMDPGTVVDLQVVRDGKTRRVSVELGLFPDDPTQIAMVPGEEESLDLGFALEPMTPDLARRMDLPEVDGLVVTAVTPGSPAEEKGLRSGDVIVEVNRRPVPSLRDYRDAVKATDAGKPVLLLVQRGEESFFVALRSGAE